MLMPWETWQQLDRDNHKPTMVVCTKLQHSQIYAELIGGDVRMQLYTQIKMNRKRNVEIQLRCRYYN